MEEGKSIIVLHSLCVSNGGLEFIVPGLKPISAGYILPCNDHASAHLFPDFLNDGEDVSPRELAPSETMISCFRCFKEGFEVLYKGGHSVIGFPGSSSSNLDMVSNLVLDL